MVKEKNINVTPNDILLTSGSSQAIDLMARVHLTKGDVVLVEKPSYQEVLRLLYELKAEVVGVESDQFGMEPDELEEKIIKHKPKFLYVNPTYGNPTGKVWSES